MKKEITFEDIKEAADDRTDNPLNFCILGFISPYVSYFFVRFLPLTPNQISFVWGFLGVLAAIVMSFGGYWYLLIGVLIYHLALLLDYVDGEIARAMRKTGKGGCTTLGGTYLDRFLHYIHRGVLILGLGMGIWRTTGNNIYLYLGISSCLFLVFDNLNKLKVYETLINEKRFDLLKKSHSEGMHGFNKFSGNFIEVMKSYSVEMLRTNNPFTLLFFSVLFDFPIVYLVIISIVSPIFFFKNLVAIYKSIGNIPT